MKTTDERVAAWVNAARRKLADGGIGEADLDELLRAVQPGSEIQAALGQARRQVRQRLLYLHASGMTTLALVIAADLREPTREANIPALTPHPELPYRSVHDAIVDGWRVLHFPRQTANPDDREVGIVGYEFILEKLEEYDD